VLVLKLVGSALVLAAAVAFMAYVYALVRRFDQRSVERFGHSFLSKAKLVLVGAAGALLHGGAIWRQSLATGGDALNGAVLMALGVAILVALGVGNFRSTDRRYAAVGTGLQFALVPLVFQLGVSLLMLLVLAGVVAAFASVKPVWVVNR